MRVWRVAGARGRGARARARGRAVVRRRRGFVSRLRAAGHRPARDDPDPLSARRPPRERPLSNRLPSERPSSGRPPSTRRLRDRSSRGGELPPGWAASMGLASGAASAAVSIGFALLRERVRDEVRRGSSSRAGSSAATTGRKGPGVLAARNLLLYETLDRRQVLLVGRNRDRVGGSELAGPARAADPVHVVFRMAGHIEVEYMAHVRNVETAGRRRPRPRGSAHCRREIRRACACAGFDRDRRGSVRRCNRLSS